MNIGLKNDQCQDTAKSLEVVLASSFTLYLKTLNFHWNVTGPHFGPLHQLFMDQYTDLSTAIDEIAERIKILGFYAPGSFEEYLKLSQIKGETKKLKANDMIQTLAKDQEIIIKALRELQAVSSKCGDESTSDLAIKRLQIHEKNLWMLNAHLS